MKTTKTRKILCIVSVLLLLMSVLYAIIAMRVIRFSALDGNTAMNILNKTKILNYDDVEQANQIMNADMLVKVYTNINAMKYGKTEVELPDFFDNKDVRHDITADEFIEFLNILPVSGNDKISTEDTRKISVSKGAEVLTDYLFSGDELFWTFDNYDESHAKLLDAVNSGYESVCIKLLPDDMIHIDTAVSAILLQTGKICGYQLVKGDYEEFTIIKIIFEYTPPLKDDVFTI